MRQITCPCHIAPTPVPTDRPAPSATATASSSGIPLEPLVVKLTPLQSMSLDHLQSGSPWDCLLTYTCHCPPSCPATEASTFVLSVGTSRCQQMGHTITYTWSIWGSCSSTAFVAGAVDPLA